MKATFVVISISGGTPSVSTWTLPVAIMSIFIQSPVLHSCGVLSPTEEGSIPLSGLVEFLQE